MLLLQLLPIPLFLLTLDPSLLARRQRVSLPIEGYESHTTSLVQLVLGHQFTTHRHSVGKRGAKPSGGECSTRPVGRPRAASDLADSR